MTASASLSRQGPPFTREGVVLGARLCLPALPGSMVFAAAFGAAAAQKGLSFAETMAMSAAVFAGISQFVALQVWSDHWTLAALATVCLTTSIINMRMVLMSASLQPWMAATPGRIVYPALLTLTDINWIIAMRARTDGHRDIGILVGSGLAIWAVWVAATAPGFLLGALTADPRRFGLDLVMPCFMVAMMAGLWKGRRQTIIWGAAGLTALATAWLLPGYWFVIAGSLAGALVGAFLDD